MRKFCVKLIFGLIIILAVTYNAQSVYSCPECGCWEQWVRLQKRTYLDKFTSLPKKEKIITLGNYQIFLTSIQLSPDTFEILIYAQNPLTSKPYLKNKGIEIHKQSMHEITPSIKINDNNIISTIRYINPDPDNYSLKISLENENTSAINSCTTSIILGIIPPNFIYLILAGLVSVMALILGLLSRTKRT